MIIDTNDYPLPLVSVHLLRYSEHTRPIRSACWCSHAPHVFLLLYRSRRSVGRERSP